MACPLCTRSTSASARSMSPPLASVAVSPLTICSCWPGHHRQPAACGQRDHGVARVGHLAFTGDDGLVRCIGVGRVQRIGRHHAAGGALHRSVRSALLVEFRCVGLVGTDVPSQLHGLMGLGRIAQRLAQLLHLLEQRHAGGEVAHGLQLLAACAVVRAQQHALAAAQGGVAVGAQLQTLSAEAAAEVVGLGRNQVAQVQLAVGGARMQLHAQLLVRIVEHQLAEALAAELLGLEAAQGGCVAVALVVGAGAVPRRSVTRREVGLGAG